MFIQLLSRILMMMSSADLTLWSHHHIRRHTVHPLHTRILRHQSKHCDTQQQINIATYKSYWFTGVNQCLHSAKLLCYFLLLLSAWRMLIAALSFVPWISNIPRVTTSSGLYWNLENSVLQNYYVWSFVTWFEGQRQHLWCVTALFDVDQI